MSGSMSSSTPDAVVVNGSSSQASQVPHQLDSLPYSTLQKVAKERGVKAAGKRAEIIQRLAAGCYLSAVSIPCHGDGCDTPAVKGVMDIVSAPTDVSVHCKCGVKENDDHPVQCCSCQGGLTWPVMGYLKHQLGVLSLNVFGVKFLSDNFLHPLPVWKAMIPFPVAVAPLAYPTRR